MADQPDQADDEGRGPSSLLLWRRAGDRMALILFGSEAYYAAPFTFDAEAVARRIETAEMTTASPPQNDDGLDIAESCRPLRRSWRIDPGR